MKKSIHPVLLVLSCMTVLAGACAPGFKPAPPATPFSSETPVPPSPVATVVPSPTVTVTPTAEVLQPINIVSKEKDIAFADTVADGETDQYLRRVLAAYKSGQIQNFDPSIQPATFVRTSENDPLYLKQGYTAEFRPRRFLNIIINGQVTMVPQNANDVFRGATIVQDGQGGLRIIQIWLQKDGSPGLVWYHLSAALKTTRPSQFSYRITAAFGQWPLIILLPIKVRDLATCRSINFIAKDDCQTYMEPQEIEKRQQDIAAWVETGMIPTEIQNGLIEFLALTTY